MADPAADPELDDLLDDALDDFGKTPQRPPASSAPAGGSASSAGGSSTDPAFDESAFADQFSRELEKMMAGLTTDPSLRESLAQVAQQIVADTEVGARAGGKGPAPQGAGVQSSVAQTLEELAKNAKSLEEGGESNLSAEDALVSSLMDELEKMMGGSGTGLPGMDDMLQGLLSREMLYQPFKDLADKYPGWLSANEASLSPTEVAKYRSQHTISTRIVAIFESESQSDSEETKKRRFKEVLDLLQEMQDLGQPPKEILGDLLPGVQFDENGAPSLPRAEGLPDDDRAVDPCKMM